MREVLLVVLLLVALRGVCQDAGCDIACPQPPAGYLSVEHLKGHQLSTINLRADRLAAANQGDMSKYRKLLRDPSANENDDADHLLLRTLASLVLLGKKSHQQVATHSERAFYDAVAQRYLLRQVKSLPPLPPATAGLAIDFHVHTSASYDSMTDAEEMLCAAAACGLAGVAIVDHDTLDGALHAQEVAGRLIAEGKLPANFLVIPGEEINTQQGHVVALFITHTIPPGITAEDTVKAIHEQGGIAIAAHPQMPDGVGALASALPFNGVETANGAENLAYAVCDQEQRAQREQAYAGLTCTRLGGSDARDPHGLAICYTLVDAPATLEGVRAALLAGRTRAVTRLTPDEARNMVRKGLTGLLFTLSAKAQASSKRFNAWARKSTGADDIELIYWPTQGAVWMKWF